MHQLVLDIFDLLDRIAKAHALKSTASVSVSSKPGKTSQGGDEFGRAGLTRKASCLRLQISTAVADVLSPTRAICCDVT